jgi:GH24 family phage-related lysozyme (muramidase)
MKISKNGLNLIKQFEGCKLTAYKDSVGVWTIGYGTTNADKAITGINITSGVKIAQTQADDFLCKSINKKYGKNIMKYDTKYHWNQNQFDALCSFAYNIGSIDTLTQNGKRSIKEISAKILAYNKAGGKELPGLTKRRKAEKALFDKAVAKKSTTTTKK